MNLSLASEIEPITDAIYDAGLGAATWTDVSRRLERCLHSRVAIFAQSEKPVEALAMCSEADDRRAREYLEHYWTDDIAMRRIRTSGSYEIIRDSDLMAEGARPRSAFYDEFLGEDAFWGVYAPVLRLERSTIVSARRPRSCGDYTSEELDLLARLQPHFRRAFRTFYQLRGVRLSEEAAFQTLEDGGVGVLFATADGRLNFASPLAERQLRDGALTLVRGFLRAATPDDTSRLLAALAAATRSGGAARTDLQLPTAAGSLMQVAISPARSGFGLVVSEPMAMLVFGRGCDHAVDERRARAAYGLSPAEARLLSALVGGERLAEFADRNGVTMTTAKTHLSRLFNKVGERRQADLIRRVLSDPLMRVRKDAED